MSFKLGDIVTFDDGFIQGTGEVVSSPNELKVLTLRLISSSSPGWPGNEATGLPPNELGYRCIWPRQVGTTISLCRNNHYSVGPEGETQGYIDRGGGLRWL